MQPTVPQIIDSIEYSLRHELIPELKTAWALQTGERMLWALEHLRQRSLHEHNNAVQENADLRNLLKLAREEYSKGTSLMSDLDPEVLEDLPLDVRDWPQSSELQEENYCLRKALDKIIEASPESDVANRDLPLWQEILSYLARQTEREQLLAAGDWPPPAVS